MTGFYMKRNTGLKWVESLQIYQLNRFNWTASSWFILTLKRQGGQFDNPVVYQKIFLLARGSSRAFLWLLISSVTFVPENVIKIIQIVQKIWRFTSSILTIFIQFFDFLTFPCYKKKLMTSHITDVSIFFPSAYFK